MCDPDDDSNPPHFVLITLCSPQLTTSRVSSTSAFRPESRIELVSVVYHTRSLSSRMKFSIAQTGLWVSSVLLAILPAALAQTDVPTPSPTVALKAIVYQGCYKSGEPLEDQGSYTYQSAGWCQNVCAAINKPVMATTKGSNCWCGDEIPPASNKVSDSECNTPCQGFGQAMCMFPYHALSISPYIFFPPGSCF